MITSPEQTVELMRDVARVLRSPVASLGEEVRALDRAEKALAAAKAERLAEMDATKAHEADGASSITTWAGARSTKTPTSPSPRSRPPPR